MTVDRTTQSDTENTKHTSTQATDRSPSPNEYFMPVQCTHTKALVKEVKDAFGDGALLLSSVEREKYRRKMVGDTKQCQLITYYQ